MTGYGAAQHAAGTGAGTAAGTGAGTAADTAASTGAGTAVGTGAGTALHRKSTCITQKQAQEPSLETVQATCSGLSNSHAPSGLYCQASGVITSSLHRKRGLEALIVCGCPHTYWPHRQASE